jgi:hypothetical protein
MIVIFICLLLVVVVGVAPLAVEDDRVFCASAQSRIAPAARGACG